MSDFTFSRMPERKRRALQLNVEAEELVRRVAEHERILRDPELESQAINKDGRYTTREERLALNAIKNARRQISIAHNRLRRLQGEFRVAAASSPLPIQKEAVSRQVRKPNASPFVGAQPPSFQGHVRGFSDVLVRLRGQSPKEHASPPPKMPVADLPHPNDLAEYPHEVSPEKVSRGMVKLPHSNHIAKMVRGQTFQGAPVEEVHFPKAKGGVTLESVQKAAIVAGGKTFIVSGSLVRSLAQQSPLYKPVQHLPHMRLNPDTLVPMPSGKVRRRWKGSGRYQELRRIAQVAQGNIVSKVRKDSATAPAKPIKSARSFLRIEGKKQLQRYQSTLSQIVRATERSVTTPKQVEANPDRRVLVREGDDLMLYYQPAPGAALVTDDDNRRPEVVEQHEIIRAHNIASAFLRFEEGRGVDDPKLKKEIKGIVKEFLVRASHRAKAHRRAKAVKRRR